MSNSNIGFNWLDERSRHSGPKMVLRPQDFEQNLLELAQIAKPEQVDLLAESLMLEMIDIYTDSLISIDHRREGQLIFAGGVGQKLQIFASEIGKRLSASVIFSNAEETTLMGLAKLAMEIS
jgi:hypothetical protein